MKNLMMESQAYYQNNDYYEIFSIAEDYPKKITKFLKEKAKGQVILDAGCGTGKFLNVLENNSTNYIGIDLSNEQLEKEKLKSKKETSKFIQANLCNIPLKDKSVDIIVSSWVLGTIKDIKIRDKCIKELKRVLKDNGKIYLIENDVLGDFEILRGRDKNTLTNDYNNYLIKNNFKISTKFKTQFEFTSIESAKKCFDVIYGKEISNKINNRIISHNIVIFENV